MSVSSTGSATTPIPECCDGEGWQAWPPVRTNYRIDPELGFHLGVPEDFDIAWFECGGVVSRQTKNSCQHYGRSTRRADRALAGTVACDHPRRHRPDGGLVPRPVSGS